MGPVPLCVCFASWCIDWKWIMMDGGVVRRRWLNALCGCNGTKQVERLPWVVAAAASIILSDTNKRNLTSMNYSALTVVWEAKRRRRRRWTWAGASRATRPNWTLRQLRLHPERQNHKETRGIIILTRTKHNSDTFFSPSRIQIMSC